MRHTIVMKLQLEQVSNLLELKPATDSKENDSRRRSLQVYTPDELSTLLLCKLTLTADQDVKRAPALNSQPSRGVT